MYHVRTSYPMSKFPAMDKEIENVVGHATSSGAGFGTRDLGWDCGAKKAKRIEAALIKMGLRVSIETE